MLTVYSDAHQAHHAKQELIGGQFQPAFDTPQRAVNIIERVAEVGLGRIVTPEAHGTAPALRVHSSRFIEFLRTAWSEWHAKKGDSDAIPLIWPSRTLRDIEPRDIEGRLGYFCADAGTPITAGTWKMVQAGIDVACTAADALQRGDRAVFAATRPPGHHAGKELFLGYCYVNFAAVAAQRLIDQGNRRVAVLDVDYHHGNGTQEIFYDRSDVLFVSIHADTRDVFPFFLGHADETGTADGEGFNLNLPQALGTGWNSGYAQALQQALERIEAFRPDCLVVSLGVDTYELDPIGQLALRCEDYAEIGKSIRSLALPTCFVMEGGYMVDHVGINAVEVLRGYESA